MKKIFLALFVAMACMPAAEAQKKNLNLPAFNLNPAEGYHRVSLSYDYTSASDIDNSIGLNGMGLNYVYGLDIYQGIFAEVGANYNVQFGKGKYKADYKFAAIQMPINVGYSFKGLVKDFSFNPYVGLNFKYNVTGLKTSYNEYIGEDESISLFDSDLMGGSTYNRFQTGWHMGVAVNFKQRYYAGLEFGTDFRPLYKYGENTMTTTNFKLALGYNF